MPTSRVLVIDFGCSRLRVGWSNEDKPRTDIPCMVMKSRHYGAGDNGPTIKIGNDVTESDLARGLVRTGHDGVIVTDATALSLMLDYSFETDLKLKTTLKDTPVVITEAFCNISGARKLVKDLLVETYGATKVVFIVDILTHLAAYALEQSLPLQRDAMPCSGLLVHIGHVATTILPVIDGQPIRTAAKRISVGVCHMVLRLQAALNLRISTLRVVGFQEATILAHGLIYAAEDFDEELSAYKELQEDYEPNTMLEMPPKAEPGLHSFQPLDGPMQQAENEDQKEKRRAAAAERMSQMREEMRKKKEEKESELRKADEAKYLELKRRQEGEAERRRKKKEEREAEEAKIRANLEHHLHGLKERHISLSTQIRELTRRRKQLAQRGTGATRARLEIIAKQMDSGDDGSDIELSEGEWNAYLNVSPEDIDEKVKQLQEEVDRVTVEIQQWDATFVNREPFLESLTVPTQTLIGDFGDPHKTFVYPIGVERIMATEALFKPYLLGITDAGLGETVSFILQQIPATTQAGLGNVMLCGGGARVPGLTKRVAREVGPLLPYSDEPNVSVRVLSEDLGAGWAGARAVSSLVDWKTMKVGEWENFFG
ncbi:Actin-related protein [Carpediemonas membranifera]|uniref:Actin-related protein n=1 Tax=Carpediemonas membranifera TaxID=201153 RepID=A0A8J6E6J7_9EUKA|nr:Actin-related protein [Carpediemonas membranifera]|eukprot:KAG9389635.1 Actin-related protein [Carpediemonas membranifera]